MELEDSRGDGNFTLSGTVEPGSTVELSEGTTPRGTTQADSSGHWSIELKGVTEGSHSYTAKATDTAGNISDESDPHTVMVDSTAPAAPSIIRPTEGSSVSGSFTVSGAAEANSTVELSEGRSLQGHRQGGLLRQLEHKPDRRYRGLALLQGGGH